MLLKFLEKELYNYINSHDFIINQKSIVYCYRLVSKLTFLNYNMRLKTPDEFLLSLDALRNESSHRCRQHLFSSNQDAYIMMHNTVEPPNRGHWDRGLCPLFEGCPLFRGCLIFSLYPPPLNVFNLFCVT